MAQTSIFKVNQLAKDLGMKNKEILAKIEGSGITVKSYMATLDPDEFNVFFDELTRENQIKDLDGYLSGKTRIARKKAQPETPKAEEVKAEVKAEEPKTEVKPEAPKAEEPKAEPTPEPTPEPAPEPVKPRPSKPSVVGKKKPPVIGQKVMAEGVDPATAVSAAAPKATPAPKAAPAPQPAAPAPQPATPAPQAEVPKTEAPKAEAPKGCSCKVC